MNVAEHIKALNEFDLADLDMENIKFGLRPDHFA